MDDPSPSLMVTLDRSWLLARLTLFFTLKVCLLAGPNISCSTSSDTKPQTGQNWRNTHTHTPHTHEPEDRVGAALRLNMDLEPPDRELSHCG